MNPLQKDNEKKILATDLTNPSLSTSGGHSDIYKCTLKAGDTPVVVKFVKLGMHGPYHRRLIREMRLRMNLDHANIIPLLGITTGFRSASFPSFVLPWMPNGDLDCYIAYHGAGIETSLKLSMSRDIASGLAYLHKFPVVHGNLESKNILLGPENKAYLTGFSLSTVLGGMSDECFKHPEKPQPGRVQFSAPECFTEGPPTIKSDIYSMGYVLFHVFSGCPPWHDVKSDDIISELKHGRMPSRPGGGGIDNKLWSFIKRCCSFEPLSRPSIADILAFLMQHKPASKVTPDDLTRMLPNVAPKPIAYGGFASIRKCTLARDGRTVQVAVKLIRPLSSDPPEKAQKRYSRELGVWGRLMHENILPLLGVATGVYASPGCAALVCPWMENGALESYLTAYPNMALRQKLQLLRDVSAGLRYLHSQDVAHGDLTNYNILVDVNGRAVVADFGLSYRLSDSLSSYSLTAAARWIAPELAEESNNELAKGPTSQSDMYSFGSIMNYVLSGEKPFQKHQDKFVFSALCKKETPFPNGGKDVSREHWKFIQQCLSSKLPRPSAEDAYKFLRTELDSTK